MVNKGIAASHLSASSVADIVQREKPKEKMEVGLVAVNPSANLSLDWSSTTLTVYLLTALLLAA